MRLLDSIRGGATAFPGYRVMGVLLRLTGGRPFRPSGALDQDVASVRRAVEVPDADVVARRRPRAPDRLVPTALTAAVVMLGHLY